MVLQNSTLGNILPLHRYFIWRKPEGSRFFTLSRSEKQFRKNQRKYQHMPYRSATEYTSELATNGVSGVQFKILAMGNKSLVPRVKVKLKKPPCGLQKSFVRYIQERNQNQFFCSIPTKEGTSVLVTLRADETFA